MVELILILIIGIFAFNYLCTQFQVQNPIKTFMIDTFGKEE